MSASYDEMNSDQQIAYDEAREKIAEAISQERGYLSFSGENLIKLPPEISGATLLSALDLRNSNVADLTPLATLSELRELDLTASPVSDLSALASLSNLEQLSLRDTLVADLAPLAAIPGLRELDLTASPVSDLSALASLTNIEKLGLRSTLVTDLKPISEFLSLKKLDISGTDISEIYSISKLQELTSIYLEESAVDDLRPILFAKGISKNREARIDYRNSAATSKNLQMSAISEIVSTKTRLDETIKFLQELPPWPEPLPWDVSAGPALKDPPIEEKALEFVDWQEGRLSRTDAPNFQEVPSDNLKSALYEQLRRQTEKLYRYSNRYPEVFEYAREIDEIIDSPLESVDMLRLHINVTALQNIRLSEQSNAEVERLDPDVIGHIEIVLQIASAITFGHPLVEEYLTRVSEFDDRRSNAAALVERNIAEALAAPIPETFDAVEADIEKPIGSPRSRLLSRPLVVATLTTASLVFATSALALATSEILKRFFSVELFETAMSSEISRYLSILIYLAFAFSYLYFAFFIVRNQKKISSLKDISNISGEYVRNFFYTLPDAQKRRTSIVSGVSVRIDDIELQNIKCFEELHVSFSDDSGINNPTLIIGDNGSGKSTILQCIALGLCPEADATGLIGQIRGGILRDGTSHGKIAISLVLGDFHGVITTHVSKDSSGLTSVRQETSPSKFPWDSVFVTGYGTQRSSARPTSPQKYLAMDAVESLFSFEAELLNPEAVFSRATRRQKREIQEMVQQLLLLEEDGPSIHQSSKGIHVRGPWGTQFVEALSDGFRSTTIWALDLIGRKFLAGRAIDAGGILLVDEIEQHLHPSWQRHIVQRISSAFPHMQIILSSHTPLIASGLTDLSQGQFVVLTRGETNTPQAAHVHAAEFRGYRSDQLLTKLFGLFTTNSPNSEADLERYAFLAGAERNQKQEQEFRELRERLDTALAFEDSAISIEVSKVLTDEIHAKFEQQKKGFDPDLVDLETRRQLRELFSELGLRENDKD